VPYVKTEVQIVGADGNS